MLYVFDLDGILADSTHRRRGAGSKDRAVYEASCDKDPPIIHNIELVKALLMRGHTVEVWTGRSDVVRDKTIGWLATQGISDVVLKMRSVYDIRRVDIIRYDWLIETIKTKGHVEVFFRKSMAIYRVPRVSAATYLGDHVIKMHNDGHTNAIIARSLKTSTSNVVKVLIELGLKPNKKSKVRRSLALLDDNTAICSSCLMKKHISQFHSLRRSKCRRCDKSQVKARLLADPPRFMYRRQLELKSKSDKNDIRFDLPEGYLYSLWQKQNGNCFYTDKEMILGVPAGEIRKPQVMSIDKIVPELGYIAGNVVLCRRRVNTIKNNTTLDEMKDWMPEWYRRAVGYLMQHNLLPKGHI